MSNKNADSVVPDFEEKDSNFICQLSPTTCMLLISSERLF